MGKEFESGENKSLSEKIGGVVSDIERIEDALDGAQKKGIVSDEQMENFIKETENGIPGFSLLKKKENPGDKEREINLQDLLKLVEEGERGEELLGALKEYKTKLESKSKEILITPEEKAQSLELALGNLYRELYGDLKNKKTGNKETYEALQEVQNELYEFLLKNNPHQLSKGIISKEVGAIIERVKNEAKTEAGPDKENEQKEPSQRELELIQIAVEATLARAGSYQEFNAPNEKEGDKIFKQKIRELWKEFAVHGIIGKDNEGKLKILSYTDLDGRCALGLFKMAGFNTKDLEYTAPGEHIKGRFNLDNTFNYGIFLEDGGQTVFISDKTGRDGSTTKFTYEWLTSLGLLRKDKNLDALVRFVTMEDNKSHLDENPEEHFKNSSRTILGLQRFVNFKQLLDYFKTDKVPTEILSEKELKKIGLEKRSQEQEKIIESSFRELKKMEEAGFIVPSGRYGKIVIDIGKKIRGGFDAVRGYGCQTYIIWNPEENSFFISSSEPIKDEFTQGIKVRDRVWIKGRENQEPLEIMLDEILKKMTDDQFSPEGELKDFIEKEKREKEIKQMIEPEKLEFFKKFGGKFYNELKEGASWEGYDEKDMRTILEIQTKVFLSKQLRKLNLVGNDKAADLVDFLLKKISK